MGERLTRLTAGQQVPYGGDRVAVVPADLAERFREGDRLVVVQESGALLHVPAAEHELAAAAVDRARDAFAALAGVADTAVSSFFEQFATRLEDPGTFEPIAAANADDVADAAARGRSTTRLELTPSMRAAMIAGLRSWRDDATPRDALESTVTHDGWRLESRRAPLGVVGFVFEGRPNVFADAVGVVRTGNAVVFRIGSDALRTARAISEHALGPALENAGLPAGIAVLLDSPTHAAGWALFGDRRLALAVARGSGPAVAQLGAVARQAGVPVSLHGTGGAWIVAAPDAEADRLRLAVENSLDRKVCNTVNVCCVPRARAAELVPTVVGALRAAGEALGCDARLHVERGSVDAVASEWFDDKVEVHRADGVHTEPFATPLDTDQLGTEWEWEGSPEMTLVVVDGVDEAVDLFNSYSPRFVASLVSNDDALHERFYAAVDAPFVGDSFTRWVDGQYALDAPELGLSNWQAGRLLARGAILSGASAHTVRYRALFDDPGVRR